MTKSSSRITRLVYHNLMREIGFGCRRNQSPYLPQGTIWQLDTDNGEESLQNLTFGTKTNLIYNNTNAASITNDSTHAGDDILCLVDPLGFMPKYLTGNYIAGNYSILNRLFRWKALHGIISIESANKVGGIIGLSGFNNFLN